MIESLYKKTKKKIYRLLRRYWQGGQERDALLPHYQNCGAPGQIRQDNGIKRGCPPIYGPQGCNIDKDMRDKIIIGAKKYIEIQHKSIEDAYKFMLEDHFKTTIRTSENEFERVLVDRYPSKKQFVYTYKRDRDDNDSLRRIVGERKYALQHRALLHKSTDLSFGPGSVFQIDAWLAKQYLVSVFDRTKIIGMPVVYLAADVFSELICGLYVDLWNASIEGAKLAFENILTDKVSFCKKYGITIEDWEWPCHHKPEILLADRAEHRGHYGIALANYSNVQVAIAAPYRADLKGLVESLFHLLDIRVIRGTPGAADKKKTRGERDPRLDATMNIYEFTQSLINAILYFNKRLLNKYPVDSDMVRQHVKPRPVELWHWGIDHRNGILEIETPESFMAKLRPRSQATVTGHGIRFKNNYYSNEEIESWFPHARNKVWTVKIAYNPRDTNQIMLIQGGKKDWMPLNRLPNPLDESLNIASFEDIDSFILNKKTEEKQAFPEELENWAELQRANKNIRDKAVKEKKEQEKLTGKRSKREKKADITENRQKEKVLLTEIVSVPNSQSQHCDRNKAAVEKPSDYVAPVYDFGKWRQNKGDDNL